MNFKVHWHDADDDRSGAPFVVQASSPNAAFTLADKQIRETVKRYVSTDIEFLEDADGQRHDPNTFLEEA